MTAPLETPPASFAILPTPVNLARVVAAVCREHPYSSDGSVDVEAPRILEDAEALWSRLGKLSSDQRTVAIEALEPVERRLLAATARPRLGMQGPRSILALTMSRHPLPNVEALAWEGWLIGDGDEPEFRRVARSGIDENAPYARLWGRLVAGDRPSEALASEWRAQRQTFDTWVEAPSVQLQQYPAFLNIARRKILARGQLATLDAREESSTIARWVAVLVPAGECDAWYAAFLAETFHSHAASARSRRWPASHAVCEAILERSGPPADGHAFWSNVSSEVREAFALWMKDRELTEYLGGENERVEFWRRFLVPMRQMTRNRDGTVVLLHFDGWVAVQFVDPGRATFLFRADAARGWRLWTDADLYRHVLALRRAQHPSYLASYQQRGYTQTWQAGASDTVDDVFRMITKTRAARGPA